MKRYHVKVDGKRTTVSLDTILSDLLALFLKETPNTKKAHAAIRAWLQQRINEYPRPGLKRVSQVLSSAAILHIADKSISEQWWAIRKKSKK